MKNLYKKLSLIAVFIGLFSFGLTAQMGMHPGIEPEVTATDPVEISYDNLPPFVKEFLYKGYEVKPEDIRKILKMEGTFLVKMNRSINVFGINKRIGMHHQKLDFVEVETGVRMIRKKHVQKVKKQRIRTILPHPEAPEIAWDLIDVNVREYLTKRLEAAEIQIYKAFDLGNDKYKIILKKSHDKFVITEDRPDRIAFDSVLISRFD